MSVSLHRDDSELAENPQDRAGDPVGADAARRDAVVLCRRLAERGYAEIAVAAGVELGDLGDPASLPPGPHAPGLRLPLPAVALLARPPPSPGPQPSAGFLSVCEH